jgi:L-tartrate/succinate antiporter
MEIVRNSLHTQFSWMQWFLAAAPLALLLLLVPAAGYLFCRPEVKSGDEVPRWAAGELQRKGPVSRNEWILILLVLAALGLWIGGAQLVDPATAALCVIVLMLVTGVLSWDDVLKYSSAWNTLVWFATLVALASGLGKVGFIGWFATTVGQHVAGLPPTLAIVLLVAVFYFSHYAFASITAHVTAVLPVMLALAQSIPHLPVLPLAILLCLTLGLMGVLTPYASGPNPVYYGSGYLPSATYWRLGAIFGVIYFLFFLLVIVPWVLWVGANSFLAHL